MDSQKNNYETTEQGSRGGSVAAKFMNEVHGTRSLPTEATASHAQAKLPEMVIDDSTGKPTEGSKRGVGDSINGKTANKLDPSKCDTKYRDASEVDSKTAGKKRNGDPSASPDGSSEGPVRDGSNEPFDDKNTPTKNEQNREGPSQKDGTDINGPGEGFDPSQKKFETDDEVSKSAEEESAEQRNDDPLVDENLDEMNKSDEDAVLEKSAEEEDVEQRNDDPLIDKSEDEDDEVDASDDDPYVKLEAGPGIKDGPQTDDEEVPTQILVMKNGRPVPRSHGSDAGREKEGLPNPAYEQTLLIESLWR